MKTANLFILKADSNITKHDFVQFWSEVYDYKNKNVYDEIIRKDSFDQTDIQRIYQWKNNMGKDQDKMSVGKQQFVDGVIKLLPEVNRLKANFNLDQYREKFDKLSAVWGILLLHLINPLYPIYDQHVHRAFAYLAGEQDGNMASTKKGVYQVYYSKYVPFYKEFSLDVDFEHKTVDDALWAFGKFLSRYSLHQIG